MYDRYVLMHTRRCPAHSPPSALESRSAQARFPILRRDLHEMLRKIASFRSWISINTASSTSVGSRVKELCGLTCTLVRSTLYRRQMGYLVPKRGEIYPIMSSKQGGYRRRRRSQLTLRFQLQRRLEAGEPLLRMGRRSNQACSISMVSRLTLNLTYDCCELLPAVV